MQLCHTNTRGIIILTFITVSYAISLLFFIAGGSHEEACFGRVDVHSRCNGAVGGGSTDGNNVTGGNSVVTAVRNSAPIGTCPNGGISVDAGIDVNGNGVLDAPEVSSTQEDNTVSRTIRCQVYILDKIREQ